MRSVREEFGNTLVKMGATLDDLIVLNADLSRSTRTSKFAQRFPQRFFNVGVSEQDLMGMAAGLALEGKTVVAATFAIFAMRAWEQIRNSIARASLNVKIIVTHSGLSDHGDGASHQSIEDIAVMRGMPNMRVIVPADAVEAGMAIEAVLDIRGPFYVRLGRDAPEVFDGAYDFEVGRAKRLLDGEDVDIVAAGVMVSQALSAAKTLKAEGVRAGVLDMHTIKPLDRGSLLQSAKKMGAIITAEEHNVIGGLGSAVAEALAEELPTPVERVGIRDCFGESGGYEELLTKYGLTPEEIVKAAKRVIVRRR